MILLQKPGNDFVRVSQLNTILKLLQQVTTPVAVVTNTGYLLAANNLSDLDDAGISLINLGGSTVGINIFTESNPSAITFLRVNADNSVDLLDAATFRAAIGAGTGGGDALTSNPLSQFAATTSAQLLGVMSDETGSGLVVFNDSPTLINPIVGTQSVNDNSTKAASTAYVDTKLFYDWFIYNALGSPIKAFTFPVEQIIQNTSIADGTCYFQAIWLPSAQTLTGVKWYQRTIGNYTADNYNGIGFYTYSGGTITEVASTTNDGTIWQTAATNSIGSKAFSSTYAASAGLYFIGFIYSSSAAVTTPALGTITNFTNLSISNLDFTNSAKLTSQLAGQTALPTPQAMSGLTANTIRYWLALY